MMTKKLLQKKSLQECDEDKNAVAEKKPARMRQWKKCRHRKKAWKNVAMTKMLPETSLEECDDDKNAVAEQTWKNVAMTKISLEKV